MTVSSAQRALCILAGSEICLVRLTSGAVSWGDLFSAAGVWCLLAAGCQRVGWARNLVALACIGVIGTLVAGGLWSTPIGASVWFAAALLLGSAATIARTELPMPQVVTTTWLVATAMVCILGDNMPDLQTMLWATAGAAAAWHISRVSLALAWVAVVVVAGCPTPQQWWSSDHPNVVLVTVDALRADAVRGHPTFDRLAQEGHSEPLWAASSWTLPSIASLLTGVPAHLHGAGKSTHGFSALDPTLPTLASVLSDAGYHTVAISAGNPFTGHRYGVMHDFDETWHPWEPVETPLPRATSRHARARPAFARWLPTTKPIDNAEPLVARTLRALDRKGPTFVWLHLMDVHLPWHRAPCRPEVLTQPGTRAALLADPWWLGDEGLACLRQGYADAVEDVDRALGVLVDGIDPERTILVVTSDHGEALGDAGLEHGHTLRAPVTRVPWLVRSPQATPIMSGGMPSLTDVPATLLAITGVAASLPGWDLTADRAPPWQSQLSGVLYGPAQRAAVDSNWMVIADDGAPTLWSWASDAQVDATTHPDAFARLLATLPAGPVASDERPEADVEHLQALGYAE